MKVQFRSSIKSNSLQRIRLALSAALGYKVWKTTKMRHDRKQFLYGDLVDKLAQYKFFTNAKLSALEFCQDDPGQVKKWLDEGYIVFGRKTLTGSQGKGIIVLDKPVKNSIEIPLCPVYTKYKPKKREFRVHVFKNTVVSIVEKRRKKDWNGDKKDAKIRNLEHGYVFCQDVDLTEKLRARIEQISLAASKVCGSDFRGVDVAYNEKNDDVFVIEVNSAPGIEGTNVQKYVQVIKQYV